MSVFALGLALLTAAPVSFPRGDDTKKDKSFATFKKELDAAVAAKDAKFMRAALSDKVQAGFGSNEGVKEFLEQQPLDEKSALWPALVSVLGKGCARTKAKEFVCPWLAGKAPEDVDWFEHSILQKDVPIRATPAEDGKVVVTRSDELVKGVAGTEKWAAVETHDGKKGHVLATQLDSPIQLRAFFEKGPKGWKLTFFGAGD